MKELPYGLSIALDLPLEPAIAAVRGALKEEGFGILTEIDVRQTLREKIGADFQPYVILGACNPPLAFAALQDDIEAGLLLPCNVTVRQEDGGSVVSILDPLVMARLSGASGLDEVSRIAREKLERVIDRLSG
ncbi:MAG: DUF302 domain-containing protein [Chloroflexi bacterium]|nr:DUF302 domain-containing protein [Chloroflexota bacterium]